MSPLDGAQFFDSLQVLQASLKVALHEHDCRTAQRQAQRNFLVTTGNVVDSLSDGTGFNTGAGFETCIDVGLQLAGGHVGSGVGFVRFGVGFAVAFEIGLDGAWLDQAEVDWDC